MCKLKRKQTLSQYDPKDRFQQKKQKSIKGSAEKRIIVQNSICMCFSFLDTVLHNFPFNF